jgi:hypothetical protein
VPFLLFQFKAPMAHVPPTLRSSSASENRAMMQPPLAALSECGDLDGLRIELNEICSHFGEIASMQISISRKHERVAVRSFVRLTQPLHEANLMATLRIGRFDDQLLFFIDNPSNFIS